MNKFLIFCFFFSTILLSQLSTYQDLQSSKISLTYHSNDTILGFPLLSHNLSFYTKKPIKDWYNYKTNKVDFENYISENNSIEMAFFVENNILSLGFPFKEYYLSFGINHYIQSRINLSNELLNLFWNGNSQYLNQDVSFVDNYLNHIQFSSIYFQCYFELNNYKMGARLNFLHGINYFNLNKGDFNLNSVNNLITPFSTYIHTNIHAQTSTASLIGFSNPGLSLDYSVNYNISNFKFSIQLENFGFIYWNSNAMLHDSNRNYLFNGFNYTMDQVISEEFQNTIDTLSDVFAINSKKRSTFITRIPLNFSFQTNFQTNFQTDFFINFQCIEQFGEGRSRDFFNLYFIGLNKKLTDKFTLYSAYNYNKFSHSNLSLGIFVNFNKFLFQINTNNILSLFNQKYFHLNTAIYYVF